MPRPARAQIIGLKVSAYLWGSRVLVQWINYSYHTVLYSTECEWTHTSLTRVVCSPPSRTSAAEEGDFITNVFNKNTVVRKGYFDPANYSKRICRDIRLFVSCNSECCNISCPSVPQPNSTSIRMIGNYISSYNCNTQEGNTMPVPSRITRGEQPAHHQPPSASLRPGTFFPFFFLFSSLPFSHFPFFLCHPHFHTYRKEKSSRTVHTVTRNLVKPERNLACRFPRGLDHSAGHPPPSMFEFISFPRPVFPSFASPYSDGRSVGLLFKVFIRPVIEKVMAMIGILGWVNLWKLIRRAESVGRGKRVLYFNEGFYLAFLNLPTLTSLRSHSCDCMLLEYDNREACPTPPLQPNQQQYSNCVIQHTTLDSETSSVYPPIIISPYPPPTSQNTYRYSSIPAELVRHKSHHSLPFPFPFCLPSPYPKSQSTCNLLQCQPKRTCTQPALSYFNQMDCI